MLSVEVFNDLLEDSCWLGLGICAANGHRTEYWKTADGKFSGIHEIAVVRRRDRSPPKAPFSCGVLLRSRQGGKKLGNLLDCFWRAIFVGIGELAEHEIAQSEEIAGLHLLARGLYIVWDDRCNS